VVNILNKVCANQTVMAPQTRAFPQISQRFFSENSAAKLIGKLMRNRKMAVRTSAPCR